MLIHKQNSYPPRGEWRRDRREAQISGTGQQNKNVRISSATQCSFAVHTASLNELQHFFLDPNKAIKESYVVGRDGKPSHNSEL
jgi:hypothetical protein